MHAQLIPLDGGKPITLKNDVTLVGRKKGLCDLIVDRGSVSKLHCLIVKTDGLLFIRDLGSTNGTKVNGQRVVRGALLPGDELAFASVRYRVQLGPSQPQTQDEEVAADEPTEMLPELPMDDDDEGSGSVPEFSAAGLEDRNSDSDVRLLPEE